MLNLTRRNILRAALYTGGSCALQAQLPTRDLSLKAPVPMVYSAAGADADSIRQTIEDFRNILGPLNAPGVTNPDPKGRREINWDGVPDSFTAPNGDLPFDFFNRNSARGMLLSSPDKALDGFKVGSGEQLGYASLRSFSGAKVFIASGTNVYDCDFFVPGSSERRAPVSGFGGVFSNVALPFSTWIEFFGRDGGSLGRIYVRPNSGGLSFVGAVFESRVVAKVRVSPGTAILGQADDPVNGMNVVAMDDFVFGEPAEA
jgi:hypothetical protein